MNDDHIPKQQITIFSVVLSLALLVCSCHHLPEPQPVSAGTSSFTFVELPPVKAPLTPSDEPAFDSAFDVDPDYFVAAKPLEPLVTPLYPPNALAGKAGLVTVGVRVMIDADGHVLELGPSLLVFSTPSRYAEEFQNAVRTAVMKWHFQPAQHYTMRTDRTNESGSTEKTLHRENTETYIDLAFTFTATGKVLPMAHD